ncbi:MAG: alpha-ketoacid dehydrogenase subunit beta [Vicinamibacteria bacterium]|nr:alpha-ketoacid dehydrogenase subunit beta [Vicinamibacteria bacterium]MBP9946521.1 alpha-ketoacid dehydrogenase subunit beta [Vicinamibacteria bacterium]
MAVLTYLEAIRQAMEQEMERDRRVFILGEDVGNYGGAFRVTQGFLEKFGPERIIDTPISETGLIGAAIGASLFGMRPIAELQFIDFIACGFNQIVNYAAKSRYRWGGGVPIVIRGPAGAGVHGGPFHSQSPESYFMNVPGLKIVVPATPTDAKGLMIAAIRDPDPVIFLEHKFLYRRLKEDVPEGDYVTPIGEARIARSGDDVSIITYGAMVHASMDAAEIVAGEGVSVEILDLRTLLPMDREAILATVRRTGRALIVHEPTKTGGPGGEIAALIAEHAFLDLDAPIVRIAPPDTPVPYSPPLEEFFLPNAAKIAEAIRALARY